VAADEPLENERVDEVRETEVLHTLGGRALVVECPTATRWRQNLVKFSNREIGDFEKVRGVPSAEVVP
jgi:hypothetical protein